MARLLILEGNTLARQREAAVRGVRSCSQAHADALRSHFGDLEVRILNAADRGQGLPPSEPLDSFDGMVIGGSGLHANSQEFEVANQIAVLKAFAQTGKPILGSCWGLQIAVVAAGGKVAACAQGREFAVARKIVLNEAGRAHPMYHGKPAVFDAPCIHLDEVERLPENAQLLASNAHSRVQAAIVPLGRSQVWGVQYHPEYDLAQIGMMLDLYAEDLTLQGFFVGAEDRTAYRALLARLGKDPKDRAAAWQLGVDQDVLDDRLRRLEIINWVETNILSQP